MTIRHFFLWTISLLTIFGCQNRDDNKQDSKLNIYVDERMELLTTVQYLSDYFLITQVGISYKKDIDKYFEKFKNHPIIPLTKKIISEGWFNGSSCPWYLYQFSFPDFSPVGQITDEENQIEEYETHLDTLELFKTQLKDFYEKTNFHQFFE